MSVLTLSRISGSDKWDVVLNSDNELVDSITIQLLTEQRVTELVDTSIQSSPGWFGNTYSVVPGWQLGSKLHLLQGYKLNEDTLSRAEGYAKECLQFLVDDGVADKIDVEAERADMDDPSIEMLALSIEITKPGELSSALIGIWEIAIS